MPSYFDVGSYLSVAGQANNATQALQNRDDLQAKAKTQTDTKNAYGLDMQDFLKLMVAQFQNQSIDDPADTSDMLNQMVQMQMVSSINKMMETMTTLTDASVMSYASSLVGKEVTIGEYDDKGNLTETVVTITGTGYSDGQQVLFAGDKTYALTSVMAVGYLPAKPGGDEGTTVNGVEGSGETEGTGNTENQNNTDKKNTASANGTEAGGTGKTNTGVNTEYDGSSGASTSQTE